MKSGRVAIGSRIYRVTRGLRVFNGRLKEGFVKGNSSGWRSSSSCSISLALCRGGMVFEKFGVVGQLKLNHFGSKEVRVIRCSGVTQFPI
jgi:hypothetical protein